jgi:pimeloyl-ACP methyl ester carboxylesterase
MAFLLAGPEDANVRALLVPGFTGSKEDFIAVLPIVAEAGVRVVAFDQAGQFESTGPEQPERFALAALGSDVVTLSRALWPDGPRPHLVGHSLGGLVARSAVLEAPNDFASLTLLSSGPAAVPEHQRPALEMLRQLLPHTDLAVLWEAKQALDESKGADPPAPDVQDFLVRRWLLNSPQGLRVKAGILLSEPDRTEQLRSCDITTLVTYGDEDDVWSPDDQAAMSQRLNAAREVMAGVGHAPAADAPEPTADILLRFWGLRTP